jgi:hypothetical protein
MPTTHNETIAKAPEPPVVYSVAEFCERAHMSRASFYTVVNAGELKAVKRGSRTLVFAAELDRFLAALPEMAANENTIGVARHVTTRKRRRAL